MTDFNGIDWAFIARRFNGALTDLMHHEGSDLHGNDLYAEALRRSISDYRTGLTTVAEAKKMRADSAATAKFNADTVEVMKTRSAEAFREHQEELSRIKRLTSKDYGVALRNRAPSVTSKFRREGVLLAASWLDPEGASGEVAP